MNAKHILAAFSVVGIVSASLVGCGDSAGTGGAGGTGSTATGTTGSKSSSTATSSSSKSTGTGTASTGTGMTCLEACQAAHPAGTAILAKGVTANCGCGTDPAKTPCKTECMGTTACADPPQDPTGACGTCLNAEAAKGAGSACVLKAATDANGACQKSQDCKDLVMCGILCP